MNGSVDVLIIGAGASGAAVAWSLADTRMHILCLEPVKTLGFPPFFTATLLAVSQISRNAFG